jgi:hypothetical protein
VNELIEQGYDTDITININQVPENFQRGKYPQPMERDTAGRKMWQGLVVINAIYDALHQ